MFSPIESRFDLGYYLKEPTQKSQKQRGGVGEPQKNAFKNLQNLYRDKIQGYLSERSWQQILYNKSVTQLFLDKMSKIYPASHPAMKISNRYEWNSSTFASMEMMHYLTSVLNRGELTEKSKNIIRNWLDTEKNYLPQAIIIDGWRITNPQILAGVKNPDVESLESATGIELNIDEEEIETMAKDLSRQMKNLEKGSSLKLLGGNLIHEVRVAITKDQENAVTIVSHDPASEITLVIKDVEVSLVEDEKFLKDLIQAKLRSNTEEILREVGKNIAEHRDHYSKARQERNSCPVQAVMKEFKYSFLSAYDPVEEGYSQYKIIKSLMAKQALKSERQHIEPAIFRALEVKEKIRSRVLEWIETLENPEKLQETFQFYEKAFAILGIPLDMEKFSMPLNIGQIAALDKKLNELVSESYLLPKEKREFQKLCSTTGAPLPIGIILKGGAESTITREFLDESIAFHKAFQGKATRLLGELFEYLPDSIQQPLVNALWEGEASIEDIRDVLKKSKVDEKTFGRIVEALVGEDLLDRSKLANLLSQRIDHKQFDEVIFRVLVDKLHGTNILDNKAYEYLLSKLTTERRETREKSVITSLLERQNGENFLLLIKKLKLENYDFNALDDPPLPNILFSVRSNLVRQNSTNSAVKQQYDIDCFINSIKFLLENKELSSSAFQGHVCWLHRVKYIEKSKALELVEFNRLIDEDNDLIEEVRLLLGDEDFITTSIQDALDSKSMSRQSFLLKNVYSYQPEKVILFFSGLPSTSPSDRNVDNLFYTLYRLKPKPAIEFKKAMLETFTTESEGATLFVSFMDVYLLDPDYMNDAAIHETVRDLLDNEKITVDTVKRWCSKIQAELDKRRRENESEERIDTCEEALAFYNKSLGVSP